MESPKKFNDCYFYYYSTCTKGDNCVFRHEPAALGCETMCSAWQQGKCLDKRCKLRHMELRKNRKQIPCYWENQPGGCRKKHCPFMHKNPDARTDGIAPSQPAPPAPAQPLVSVNETVPSEQQPMPTGVTPAVPAPAPVPLLWQQQRQVVLDSAILGVLPASTDLLGGRRVLPPHAHDGAPNPYAPLPVDPLVVNFEEESDNESAPSSTPTKTVSPDDTQGVARSKSQEILLLEKIQAEAAAYYSYENLPSADINKERKIVRTNLNTKYERLSLDELTGNKHGAGERRNSLDFKVLSLEEIRARKKSSDTIVNSTPITLNLSRKRKSSTQETITTSGNKIIKVVRSNSIVYKKVDNSGSNSTQNKVDLKDENISRKRTISEQTDIYADIQDELVDNCFEFKRIKLTEQKSKPRLIRNISNVSNEPKDIDTTNKADNDSDSEVQIVSIDITDEINLEKEIDCEVIELDENNTSESLDVVDLSDDLEETASDIDFDLAKNVPDVVASCQKNSTKIDSEKALLKSIDSLIEEEL